MAKDMLDSIPARAANMIRAGTYAGGSLLKVDSDISRPSFREKCLQKSSITNPKHFQFLGQKISCILVDLNSFLEIIMRGSYILNIRSGC